MSTVSYLKLGIICLGIFFTHPAAGQKIVGKKIMATPTAYTLKNKSGKTNKTPWVVFADRPDQQSAAKLHFMQAFYVVDEKEDYVHIVAYNPDLIDRNGTIQKGLKNYGWMAKDHLLLHQHALVNSTTRFSQIALLKTPVFPPFYEDPALKEKSSLELSVAPSGIYFIMKRDARNGSLLLSRSPTINESGIDVLGWTNKEAVFEWTDRICLEPNWDKSAVQARTQENWRAMVFSSRQAAKSYMKKDTIGAVLWDKDLYDQRFSPSIFRLIFADRGTSDLFEVLVPRKSEEGLGYFAHGYTPKKFDGVTAPIFKKTILVAEEELAYLTDQYERIYQALLTTKKHKQAITALKKILSSLFSSVPCEWPNPLSKLLDGKDFSEEDMDDLLDCLDFKLEEMKAYADDQNNRFRMYKRGFYWLPVELLP